MVRSAHGKRFRLYWVYTSIPGVHSSSIVREVQCTILVLIMRSILVACYVEGIFSSVHTD